MKAKEQSASLKNAEGDKSVDETSLIQTYLAPLAADAGLGLNDDAACITPKSGHDLVFTVDTLVAGRHFFKDDDPFDVAIKAVTVNRSDLVAKGADPVGYLLALSLPEKPTHEWMMRFSTGLAEQITGQLLGGDTTKTDGPLTISITAIGEVPTGKLVRRDGAKKGDILFLTGQIGTSAMGLNCLRDEKWAAERGLTREHIRQLVTRYYAPKVESADEYTQIIRNHASACLDVSDGLAIDLERMCKQSRVGADIDLRQLPVHPIIADLLTRKKVGHDELITGGDDYVCLMAVAPDQLDPLLENAGQLPLYPIGKLLDQEKGVTYRRSFWRKLSLDGKTGYDHFA